MIKESRVRMNTYSVSQRKELEISARRTIKNVTKIPCRASELKYVLFHSALGRFGVVKSGVNRDSTWYETEELLAATKFDSHDAAKQAINNLDNNERVLEVITTYETTM